MIAKHISPVTPIMIPSVSPNKNVIIFFPPHALFLLRIFYSNNLQVLLFCTGNTSILHSRFPCHYIVYSFPVPRLGIVLFLSCSVLLVWFWKWFQSHNACPINFIFTIYPILSQCPLLTMQKSSSVMDLFLDPLCPHFKTTDNFHFSTSPSSGVGFSNSSAASL